jgi:dihydrofolate reductase
MRKLIVTEFVSLDGVMEAPGGEPGYRHSGWTMDFPMEGAQLRFKLDEVLDAASLLLGRVTYEGFAEAWPDRTGEFADRMNGMPKHVVSSTLRELTWENSTLLEGDFPSAVRALKSGEGGDILVAGSRTLVQALVAHALADEYRLMVYPVILGSGRRLFPDDLESKANLSLVDTTLFENGVSVSTYRPA